MPKNFTEYTEEEIKELIAKTHDVPVGHVALTHIKGNDSDIRGQHMSPRVSARVLLTVPEKDGKDG